MQPTVTRADYLAQLVRIYGLVAPFESACKYTPHVDRALGVRSRAGLIAQDLLVLGLSASQVAMVPQCAALATFEDVAEAAGWFYVIERSTLLQDGIRRHLSARLPEVSDACSYLAAFDSHGAHWSTVARLLDDVGARPDVADDMLATAGTGFEVVTRWFDEAA